MIVRLVLAALAFVMLASNAEARTVACIETGSTMHPVCMWSHVDNPFSGATRIRVTMHRVRRSEGAITGGKPAGCPQAWCGCWLASHLGISDRSLWLARNWAAIGRPSGPQVGAIAVWRHHVGQIQAVNGNNILLLSGNDGHAVRQRWRSTRGIIAYREI